VLDLVEGVISELGERTVGFTIDDDDLVELRTVRDAVDCVLAGLGSAESR
jgi:acyl carrier protein